MVGAQRRGRQRSVLQVGNLAARRDFMHLDDAIDGYRALVETRFAEAREREFDFGQDYRLLNQLAGPLILAPLQALGNLLQDLHFPFSLDPDGSRSGQLSAPASPSILATRRAVMGTRAERGRRSWRA